MSCFLNLPGNCEACRACGSGRPDPQSYGQIVRDVDDCAPGCTRCAPLRRMVGDGPISMMAYKAYQTSIEAAVRGCPMQVLRFEKVDQSPGALRTPSGGAAPGLWANTEGE